MLQDYVGRDEVSFWWSALAAVVGMVLIFGSAFWREWKRQAEDEAHRRFIGHQTTEGEP